MSTKTLFTKSVVDDSTILFLLRATLGVIFFAHGAQKVLGWYGGYGLEATIQYFQQGLGIPLFLAYIGLFAEFLGGIAIIVGSLSRVFAFGFAAIMLVAIFQVHLPNGFFMNWGSVAGRGEGIEYNLALLIMSVAVFLLGPGKYSVDHKLFAGSKKERELAKQVTLAS